MVRLAKLDTLGPQVWLWRDDLAFPNCVGSKWRKLVGALDGPLDGASAHATPGTGEGDVPVDTIVTMGGAYSNHLHAVALWGYLHNIATVGIVRGEAADVSNPTLAFCQRAGMTLHRVAKRAFDQGLADGSVRALVAQYGAAQWLPAGGDTAAAQRAAAGIVGEIDAALAKQLDATTASEHASLRFVVGAGSGATAKGIAAGLVHRHARAGANHLPCVCVAVPAAPMLGSELDRGANRQLVWRPAPAESYAEVTPARLQLIEAMYATHGIVLDPIYASRACLAVTNETSGPVAAHAAEHATVIVHTGGVQAWAGVMARGKLPLSPPLQAAIEALLTRAFELPSAAHRSRQPGPGFL